MPFKHSALQREIKINPEFAEALKAECDEALEAARLLSNEVTQSVLEQRENLLQTGEMGEIRKVDIPFAPNYWGHCFDNPPFAPEADILLCYDWAQVRTPKKHEPFEAGDFIVGEKTVAPLPNYIYGYKIVVWDGVNKLGKVSGNTYLYVPGRFYVSLGGFGGDIAGRVKPLAKDVTITEVFDAIEASGVEWRVNFTPFK